MIYGISQANQIQNTMQSEPSADKGFGKLLGEALQEVNTLLQTSDEKQMELALGKTDNLHDALITMEKAETSLKLITQIRNKALEAYNDILRMQL